MSRPSPDHFFAQLWLDFLNHASSIEAGVPLPEDLQRLVLGSGTVSRLPLFVLSGKELSGGSNAKRRIHLMGGLLFRNRALGPDAATDAASLAHSTEFYAASQFLDVLESRMLDLAALGQFIAGLDAERRDGFRIQKVHRLPQPDLNLARDKPEVTLFCALEIDCIWFPQTA